MNNSSNSSCKNCFEHLQGIDTNVKIVVTVLHASLIPLIIGANLVLIFGITKTKRKKFTSSQILFLTLFSSDLIYGVVQIPLEIYVTWNKNKNYYPSCFESIVGSFSIIYPLCMSGTILSAIGVDRYIRVVHNKYCKRIITNKSLTVTITLTILTSIVWATVQVFMSMEFEHFFIAMSTYTGAVLAVGVGFNVALLKHVKQKTKNSSVPQAVNTSLTKTVTLILASLVVAYLPLMITLIIISFALIHHCNNKVLIRKVYDALVLTLIPPQVNAVLNSVIYFSRNSRLKRYFYKLLISGNESTPLTKPISNVWYLSFDKEDI